MFFLLVVAAAAVVSCGHAASIPRELNHPPTNGGRVVGGVKTVIELHPHQIALQNSSFHLKCGGSIISEYYVLTAGHCVESILHKKNYDNWTIRSGSTFQTHGGTIHQIAKVIRHEDYEGSPANDVTVIRVKKPFKFDDTRQPIELNHSKKEIKAGTIAVISGYGTIYTKGPLPTQLMTTSVPIVSKKDCEMAYLYYGGIHKGEICAGYVGIGGKDTCQGDSGGPLTIDGKLAGVVSYGIGCADPDFPGVYAEVSYFYDWIVEHAELNVH